MCGRGGGTLEETFPGKHFGSIRWNEEVPKGETGLGEYARREKEKGGTGSGRVSKRKKRRGGEDQKPNFLKGQKVPEEKGGKPGGWGLFTMHAGERSLSGKKPFPKRRSFTCDVLGEGGTSDVGGVTSFTLAHTHNEKDWSKKGERWCRKVEKKYVGGVSIAGAGDEGQKSVF